MLGRYSMRRGARAEELPAGVRQDTRKHTRHPLRPEREAVEAYLGGTMPWEAFRERYIAIVEERMAEDRQAFDRLAELARAGDLYLGCSCPTKANPSVRQCHTWLALELMQRAYPDLDVQFLEPEAPRR